MMPCHIMPSCANPYRIIICLLLLHCVISCRIVSSRVQPCCVFLCPPAYVVLKACAMPCRACAVPHFVFPSMTWPTYSVILCHIVPCHTLLYFALCHTMPNHAMSCHTYALPYLAVPFLTILCARVPCTVALGAIAYLVLQRYR